MKFKFSKYRKLVLRKYEIEIKQILETGSEDILIFHAAAGTGGEGQLRLRPLLKYYSRSGARANL